VTKRDDHPYVVNFWQPSPTSALDCVVLQKLFTFSHSLSPVGLVISQVVCPL